MTDALNTVAHSIEADRRLNKLTDWVWSPDDDRRAKELLIALWALRLIDIEQPKPHRSLGATFGCRFEDGCTHTNICSMAGECVGYPSGSKAFDERKPDLVKSLADERDVLENLWWTAGQKDLSTGVRAMREELRSRGYQIVKVPDAR